MSPVVPLTSPPGSSMPPMSVPTLTEVVEWNAATMDETAPHAVLDLEIPELADVVGLDTAAAPAASALRSEAQQLQDWLQAASAVRQPAVAPASIDVDALTQRVLAQLMPHVEAMLEQRLTLVMAPVLERVAQALAQDARDELESALHDVVADAVAQELQRERFAHTP
jgi:hypothetical protein